MKFRTEIEHLQLSEKIGYRSRIFAAGSCFADSIASRLQAARFRVAANPAGVMFNPVSVAAMISRCAECRGVSSDEVRRGAEGMFHFDFHGSFTRPSAAEAAAVMTRAVEEGSRALAAADTVIITLGTAWVFRHAETGRIVANCHKEPASAFVRERLSVEDTVQTLESLLSGPLAGRHVILTVSPVRHKADGLSGNMVSKAVLRLAVDEVVSRHERVDYFPSFEIMYDDLRDYRFYDRDMVHPSAEAIDYIAEKFLQAAADSEALSLMPRVEAVVAAAAHRPLHPRSDAWRTFLERTLAESASLPGFIDLDAERMVLNERLRTARQTQ